MIFPIDGTVEGTDISFDDTGGLYTDDHTYYGNYCDKDESDNYHFACSTQIVQTYDGEPLKTGVAYSYAAASSGSGRDDAPENTNSPDTFCPLGWQLPYGGTGGDYYDQSKSINYLFSTYNIENTEAGSASLRSYPVSYTAGGLYYFGGGKTFGLTTQSQFWSGTEREQQTAAYYVLIRYVFTNSWVSKYNGRTLRCAKFLASNHRRHGGRNSSRYVNSPVQRHQRGA